MAKRKSADAQLTKKEAAEQIKALKLETEAKINNIRAKIGVEVDKEPIVLTHCVICHQNFNPKRNGKKSCTVEHDCEDGAYERGECIHCRDWDCFESAYCTRCNNFSMSCNGNDDSGPAFCYQGRHYASSEKGCAATGFDELEECCNCDIPSKPLRSRKRVAVAAVDEEEEDEEFEYNSIEDCHVPEKYLKMVGREFIDTSEDDAVVGIVWEVCLCPQVPGVHFFRYILDGADEYSSCIEMLSKGKKCWVKWLPKK
jgi:hypothetical protein